MSSLQVIPNDKKLRPCTWYTEIATTENEKQLASVLCTLSTIVNKYRVGYAQYLLFTITCTLSPDSAIYRSSRC